MKYLLTTSMLLLLLLTIHVEAAAQIPWLSNQESIDQFRKQVESMSPDTSQFELQIEDRTIQLDRRAIGIRIYKPDGSTPKPGLIYVHGACWVAGSLDSHDEVCRYLSIKGDVVVVAIDYRLAPEHKYPAAHDDVYEATQWIWKNAKELSIDPTRLAISGESAGAYFAAATTLKAHDQKNGPDFKFQLLVYAAIDGGGPTWPECKGNYFNDSKESRSRYGSPLWATDLSGLPPTYNIRGEYEVSRAEEELFIWKLKDQGVNTQSYLHEGVGHDVRNWMMVKTETPGHLKAVEFIKKGFE